MHAAEPDVVIVAPCGFDRAGSQRLADELVAGGALPAGVPVHAVDANASWARPGTRLPDGVEELAAILDEASPSGRPLEAGRLRAARSGGRPG